MDFFLHILRTFYFIPGLFCWLEPCVMLGPCRTLPCSWHGGSGGVCVWVCVKCSSVHHEVYVNCRALYIPFIRFRKFSILNLSSCVCLFVCFNHERVINFVNLFLHLLRWSYGFPILVCWYGELHGFILEC